MVLICYRLKNIFSLVLVCAFATTTVTQSLQKQRLRGTNSNLPTNFEPELTVNENLIATATQKLAIDISESEWNLSNKGNFLQSPISIGSLLNLLLLGTDGESHSELKKALRYSIHVPSSTIHEKYRDMLMTSFDNQVKGVNINMDSRLFLQMKAKFHNSFVKDACFFYRSNVTNLDFARNPWESTESINRWVNETTYGKITKIFQESLPPSTTFVAANTIYFNGGWEEPFSKNLTVDDFFLTGLKKITIPMMSNEILCTYLDDSNRGFEMISLPYLGGNHAMYIIKPKGNPDVNNLHRIESGLDYDVLNTLIKEMKPAKKLISIPRMRISHKIDLKEILQQLGVNKIFNPEQADFSKLTTSIPGVFVDSVLHEAVLDVTESGTIAAAVTSLTATRIVVSRFTVDRPSLFFIRDERNGVILFWARVVEPEPIYLPAKYKN